MFNLSANQQMCLKNYFLVWISKFVKNVIKCIFIEQHAQMFILMNLIRLLRHFIAFTIVFAFFFAFLSMRFSFECLFKYSLQLHFLQEKIYFFIYFIFLIDLYMHMYVIIHSFVLSLLSVTQKIPKILKENVKKWWVTHP